MAASSKCSCSSNSVLYSRRFMLAISADPHASGFKDREGGGQQLCTCSCSVDGLHFVSNSSLLWWSQQSLRGKKRHHHLVRINVSPASCTGSILTAAGERVTRCDT